MWGLKRTLRDFILYAVTVASRESGILQQTARKQGVSCRIKISNALGTAHSSHRAERAMTEI